MIRAQRLAAAVLFGAVLLASCASSSPADELRSKVAAVTDAANRSDVNGLARAVDDLLSTAKGQHDRGDLNPTRYRQIELYASRLRADAVLLNPVPSRTPAPAPSVLITPPQTTPPATTAPAPTGKGEGDGKGKGGKKHDASPSPSLSTVLPTGTPVATASP